MNTQSSSKDTSTEPRDTIEHPGPRLVVRELQRGDLVQLAKLQLAVFKKKRTVDDLVKLLEWKYFANPHGQANAIVIEAEGSEIIGVFASIPSVIKVNQVTHVVQLVVNIAVAPQYQKQGLFSLLANAHESLIKQRYASTIVCGFPNSLALVIGKKHLSSRTITTFPVYHIPLSRYGPIRRGSSESRRGRAVDRLLRIVHSVAPLRISYAGAGAHLKLSAQRLEALPHDYDLFWEKVSQQYRNGMLRDRKYLQWRIFDEPSGAAQFYAVRQEGVLIGYFAFQAGRDLKIIDYCVYRDHELIDGLISEMIKAASGVRGARYITFPLFDRQLEILFARYRPLLGDSPTLVYTDYSEAATNCVVEEIKLHGWFLGGSDFWLG